MKSFITPAIAGRWRVPAAVLVVLAAVACAVAAAQNGKQASEHPNPASESANPASESANRASESASLAAGKRKQASDTPNQLSEGAKHDPSEAATPAAQDAGELPEESVLVAAESPRKGTLDETLTAYGVLQPPPGGALAVSMPYAGQLLRLRVTAGERVSQGTPLFDYGTDPSVTLAWQKAVSALSLATQERAHAASLAAQKLATQSQLDQAETAVLDARAQVETAQQLGGDKPSQTVVAPFTGVVASITATNGDRVQANAPILQLAQKGGLVAVLAVQPEQAGRIAADMPVRLLALSQPTRPAEGRVLSIGGQLDPKSQLLSVVVALHTGAPMRPLPGEHVRGQIALGGVSGWIVPRQAVLTDESGPYLFQIAAGRAVHLRVSILGESGDRMAVDGPIDPRRPLVVAGNYELADGTAVREETAAAPQETAGGVSR